MNTLFRDGTHIWCPTGDQMEEWCKRPALIELCAWVAWLSMLVKVLFKAPSGWESYLTRCSNLVRADTWLLHKLSKLIAGLMEDQPCCASSDNDLLDWRFPLSLGGSLIAVTDCKQRNSLPIYVRSCCKMEISFNYQVWFETAGPMSSQYYCSILKAFITCEILCYSEIQGKYKLTDREA